jgi:hypothetical protein
MKATAKAKRDSKEQGGGDKLTYVHDEIPVLSPARANLTGQKLINAT